MGFKFGRRSKRILKELHPDLQFLLKEAIKVYDFTILEGWRSKERQQFLVESGKSKLRWPRSKHNTKNNKPGRVIAVDIAPYPIDWADRDRFILLYGIIEGIASYNNIKIRWGGAWKGLSHMGSNDFNDLPHIELV